MKVSHWENNSSCYEDAEEFSNRLETKRDTGPSKNWCKNRGVTSKSILELDLGTGLCSCSQPCSRWLSRGRPSSGKPSRSAYTPSPVPRKAPCWPFPPPPPTTAASTPPPTSTTAASPTGTAAAPRTAATAARIMAGEAGLAWMPGATSRRPRRAPSSP